MDALSYPDSGLLFPHPWQLLSYGSLDATISCLNCPCPLGDFWAAFVWFRFSFFSLDLHTRQWEFRFLEEGITQTWMVSRLYHSWTASAWLCRNAYMYNMEMPRILWGVKMLEWAGRWWCTPLILGLGRQRQEDLWIQGLPGLQDEFQDNQGYTEKLCLKKQTSKQNKTKQKTLISQYSEST